MKKAYEESVDKALRRITEHIPEDLVQKFAQESGITREDIHPIPPARSGMVTAVDGSNTMVLEGGSVAIAAIRAVQTTFLDGERHHRSITPLTLVTIGPGHRNRDFDELYEKCFGTPPHKGLDNADPERASAILRDTLEYWVAQQTVRTLPEGALLLLDGALRVSSQNHEPVLASIITTAQERGHSPCCHRKADPGNVGRRAPAPSRNRRTRSTPWRLRALVGEGGRAPPRPHRVPPGKAWRALHRLAPPAAGPADEDRSAKRDQ